MDEIKTKKIEDILFDISLETDFKICEMEVRKFMYMFFDKLYKELKETDEIVLGEIGSEFYSIKRTPTIQETQDKLDRSKVIVSQGELENNFKVFFTKRRKGNEECRIKDLL